MPVTGVEINMGTPARWNNSSLNVLQINYQQDFCEEKEVSL